VGESWQWQLAVAVSNSSVRVLSTTLALIVGGNEPGQTVERSGIRLYWDGLCGGKDFAAGGCIWGIVSHVMFRLDGKGFGLVRALRRSAAFY
jgi:hypothetical protein